MNICLVSDNDVKEHFAFPGNIDFAADDHSLRSKRFQSTIARKLERDQKKGGRGRGRGEEETLARKPHDSEKRPLIFHGSARL